MVVNFDRENCKPWLPASAYYSAVEHVARVTILRARLSAMGADKNGKR